MRSLVLYYSFGGNTREIADKIAEETGSDREEIRIDRKIDSSNFLQYSWDSEKKNFKVLDVEKDPEEYDLIFLGTPVWAWAPAPPIYAFFEKYPLKGKEIAVFSTSEGDCGNCFERIRSILKGNKILKHKEFVIPPSGEMGDIKDEAGRWAGKVIKSRK